jgi:hypothetical protein
MITASSRTTGTPDRLWRLASDVERWGERLPTVTSVTRLGGAGPVGVGDRFAMRQPGLPKAVWEVTEWVEGRRFTWVSTAPGVRSEAAHAVAADGDGARLELSLDWTGPLAPVLRLLVGRKAQRYVDTEAATFARLAR